MLLWNIKHKFKNLTSKLYINYWFILKTETFITNLNDFIAKTYFTLNSKNKKKNENKIKNK